MGTTYFPNPWSSLTLGNSAPEGSQRPLTLRREEPYWARKHRPGCRLRLPDGKDLRFARWGRSEAYLTLSVLSDLTEKSACFFYPRCEERIPICKKKYPPKISLGGKGFCHCWGHNKGEQDEIINFIESNALKPVKVLNTHCHVDHMMGNAFFYKQYNLKPIIHESDLKVLGRITYFRFLSLII